MDISNAQKANIDLNTINTLYRHYKNYFIPLLVIVGSIFAFFLFVMPGFQQFNQSREELKQEQAKLEILKNNYNFLSNLDEEELNHDYEVLARTLPSNKDFAGILNAISFAASATGVSLGDFQFSLGDLAKAEGSSSVPSVTIDIRLTANARDLTRFAQELYKTVPITEAYNFRVNNEQSILSVYFFYKPFPPENISAESPITPLTQQNKEVIDTVVAWNNATGSAILELIPGFNTISTESGQFNNSTGTSSNPFGS